MVTRKILIRLVRAEEQQMVGGSMSKYTPVFKMVENRKNIYIYKMYWVTLIDLVTAFCYLTQTKIIVTSITVLLHKQDKNK